MRSAAIVGVTLVAVLGCATQAGAAPISGFHVSPSTTASASHPTLRGSVSVAPDSGGLKDAVLHLPPGLFASERAPVTCTIVRFNARRCGRRSSIGSLKAQVLTPVGRVSASGTLIFVAPTGAEAARVGAIVTDPPQLAGFGLTAPVSFRATQDGLDIVASDIPRSIGGVPVSLERLELAVKGRVNDAPFTYGPTACIPATTTVEVATYSDPGARSAAASTFTPSGCDRVPFRPGLRFSVGGKRPPLPARRPPLDLQLSLRPGDSGFRTADLFIPPALSADNASPALQSMCSPEQLAAGMCPIGSIIGTGDATTPLLRKPLRATFYLMRRPTENLPGISIVLSGKVRLQLDLRTRLVANRIATSTDRIPDVPHGRFNIHLFGGDHGVLVVKQLLCGNRIPGAQGDFSSYAGSSRSVRPKVAVRGCKSID